MEIKRNGFVFKFLFGSSKYAPEKIGIFSLFWRFTWMFFIGWPMIFITYCFLFLIALIFDFLGYFWGFWSAKRPNELALAIFFRNVIKDEPQIDSEEYELIFFEKWPKIKGHRIYPFWFLILILPIIAFLKWTEETAVFMTTATKLTGQLATTMLGSVYFWSITSLAVAGLFLWSKRKSQSFLLFRRHLITIKERLFPPIRIVD